MIGEDACMPKRESEIEIEMQRLDREIEGAVEAFNRFTDRVSSIMRNEPEKCTEVGIDNSEPNTAHAKRLSLFVSRVSSLGNRIEDLKQHIEL